MILLVRMMKQLTNKQLEEYGNDLKVQKNITDKMNQQLNEMEVDTVKIVIQNKEDALNLADLDKQMENLIASQNIPTGDVIEETELGLDALAELLTEVDDEEVSQVKKYQKIELLEISDKTTWDEYQHSYHQYAQDNSIDLTADPFKDLMTETEKIEFEERIQKNYILNEPAHCDKEDYAISVLSGMITGLIDVFFVGEPSNNSLELAPLAKWSDNKTDDFVKNFGNFVWKIDKSHDDLKKNKRKRPKDIAGWIGFLEERFRVPYDARYASDLGVTKEELKMNPQNHHLKSLAHSPGLMGLFFSILDQFMNTTSVISNGQIISFRNNSDFELQGTNFFSKVFCGFTNWFGHLVSDMSGSSGTRGNYDNRRGAGIPAPLYNLTQLICTKSTEDKKGTRQNIAEIAEKIFKNGFDFRFVAAQSIPVIINELFIRFMYAVKRVFGEKLPVKEVVFGKKSPELRKMLLISVGVLCGEDGAAASIKAFKEGGSPSSFEFWVELSMNANIVAWSRFGLISYQEISVYFCKNQLDVDTLEQDIDRDWKSFYMENAR